MCDLPLYLIRCTLKRFSTASRLAGRLPRGDAPPPIARPRNVQAERPTGQELRVAAGGMVTRLARCRLNERRYFEVDHPRRAHLRSRSLIGLNLA
jgi:hypothetical protein